MNETTKQERTTQLGSRNETTQLGSRNETTQLVSRNETTQLCTAVDRLYSRIGFFYLLLTNHDISGTIKPMDLKFGRQVPLIE
ncbi:hypothetical protein TNCV_2835731 [Trichonephila clavipes]|nr:hypothetical protein TNCV_2835731 [Trichonephila clavipes]